MVIRTRAKSTPLHVHSSAATGFALVGQGVLKRLDALSEVSVVCEGGGERGGGGGGGGVRGGKRAVRRGGRKGGDISK